MMRLLLVTPLQPRNTGNQVTALRYQQAMRARGHRVRLVEVGEEDAELLRKACDDFRPDVVHLLHAYRSGRPWLEAAAKTPAAYVVSLTGTDLHQGVASELQGPLIRRVLAGAAAVLTQNRLTWAALKAGGEGWTKRLHYLPPAILLGDAPYPLRERHRIPADHVLFLHPAGIRPVKGNLELLRLFDAVAAVRDGFTAAFCGTILDEAYGRQFLAGFEQRPWARYLGTIPAAAMAAALAETDVVLNNSSCEGLANALVEAVVLGRPLLVRDIPGNAAVVEEGGNGLLYHGAADFTAKAISLIDSVELRQRLSRPDPVSFAPGVESEALEKIYRRVFPSAPSQTFPGCRA